MSPRGSSTATLTSAGTPMSDGDSLVLVVDDDRPGLYVKTRALTQAGFAVIEATSGEQALAMVAAHRPAVVVLDVLLPDVDGRIVCRTIKKNPESATTKVLQISAYYTDVEDHVLGLENGADTYLPGDVPPALLVAAVRALLRTRDAEKAVRENAQLVRLTQALRRSQDDLRALTARLWTAEEDERRRIARDTHDDFCQRLAFIEMELRKLREFHVDVESALAPITDQVVKLTEDLRNFSHTVHPTALEDLGLEAALRSLCEDFETGHGLATRYVSTVESNDIPLPISLTLYRIAQEALRNVARHAGDARATVTLFQSDRDLCLTVEDDGCGFDLNAKADDVTLGLVSMNERARLINGTVEITSTPGRGTKVEVRVPWPDANVS